MVASDIASTATDVALAKVSPPGFPPESGRLLAFKSYTCILLSYLFRCSFRFHMKELFRRGIFMILLGWSSLGSHAQVRDVGIAEQHQREGHKLFLNQRYTESTYQYRLALKESISRKDTLTWADLHATISTNYYVQGEYQKAISECRKGIKIISKYSHNDSIRFKLYLNQTISFVQLGKYDSSTFSFTQGERILNKNINLKNQIPGYIVSYYNSGGVLYNVLGDFQLSRMYLEKALIIGKKHKLAEHTSALLNNISTQYSDIGSYKKAIDLCLESLEYKLSSPEKIIRYLNLGRYYLQIDQYKQAFKNYKQAKDVYTTYKSKSIRNRDIRLEINIPFGLARYFFAMGDYEQAEKYLFEAIESQRSQNGLKHPELAKLYIWQGRIREAQHRWDDAVYYYQLAINTVIVGPPLTINENRTLSLNGEILSDHVLFEALQRKAHALTLCYERNYQLVDLRFALETYKVAIRMADQIRRGYETAETKLFFLNQVYPTYEQALSVTYRLYQLTHQAGYRDMAFQIMEKSKASTLSDALRDAQVKPTVLPVAMLAKERELNKRLTDLRNLLSTTQLAQQTQTIKNQIIDLELELSELLKKFERVSPQYYQFKYRTETVQLKRIQENVTDQETALVSYFMGQRDLYTFVVTQERTEFIHQSLTPAFRKQLETFRQELYTSPGIDVYKGTEAAQTCHQWLIQPIEKLLVGKKRLVFVRDTELHFIPFEALESGRQANDYLIKHYAIRYAYSATLLQQGMRQTARLRQYDVLAMAPYAELSAKTDRFRDKNLGPLPASRQEVASIGGQTFYDGRATKEQFLREYQQHEILHLATHARADEADPARSYIAFYPDRADHKLFTSELYNLSLQNARLVVLSACETGMGQLHRSEGMLSLSRAFMYAGCPSIVTTLWNAHDESSAYLSKRLHQYLRQGFSTDKALQQAKLDYFESEQSRAYDHPYYWAHFILIGDDAPVYQPPIWSRYAFWAGVGIILFVVGILVSRYRIYATKKEAAV